MRYRFALATLAVALPSYAVARRTFRDVDLPSPTFDLIGRPVGGAKPAAPTAAYLTASRIAAVDGGALAIDADSGTLIRTDSAGSAVAQLAIGADAGLLAYDPDAQLAYVADRQGDRVAVVSVGEKLALSRALKTPAEPYAVALTPDRKTLLVAAIADRALVALDPATGAERWRTALGREPRGLAVSPDGARALVSYLATGTVDQISLATHRAEHVALAAPASSRRLRGIDADSFARAAFAVTFLGEHQAVVPFQRETPVQLRDGAERADSYGGGHESPVTHQLAFLSFGKAAAAQATAQIAQHQPRALAWDAQRDLLYIAGLGSDTILQVKRASTIGISEGASISVSGRGGAGRCGPDGLAIAPGGGALLVWCSFTRSVATVSVPEDAAPPSTKATTNARVALGPSLVASRLTPAQHGGMVLFHTADAAMSERGAMACATCHPDGRTDGLSWRIERHELQTPILAGRVANTHPYKWDGGDKDLTTSLTMTMKRLGGRGLDPAQTAQLEAYVSMLPSVRAPTRDPATVARGKQLFDSAAVGCRTCHDGPTLTDQGQHKFQGGLAKSDTPSLRGLAASAPYYHDGSAATLEALLRDRGAVHGMSEAARLSDKDVVDLIAFLETL